MMNERLAARQTAFHDADDGDDDHSGDDEDDDDHSGDDQDDDDNNPPHRHHDHEMRFASPQVSHSSLCAALTATYSLLHKVIQRGASAPPIKNIGNDGKNKSNW